MSVFTDTSAFIAVLDATDENHPFAKVAWERLITENEQLVCSNYVLVETFAITQSRLGIEAVRAVQNDIVPILTIEWVDDYHHNAGVASVLASMRKKLSLVDCISFNILRKLGMEKVFTFDKHFKEQGFTCIP